MSKVILITGANRGIGFCIAQGIAERLEDCCILVASRDLSAAKDAISKLRHLKATFEPVELDVASDDSITACLETIRKKHGRLDGTSTHPLTTIQQGKKEKLKRTTNALHPKVLINNAAIASNPQPSNTNFRSAYNLTLNTNLTSPALLTTLSFPLLHLSSSPLVINLSSARASLHAITTGTLPPTACIPYSVSKVALNALTLEFSRSYPEVEFCVVSPGHCRTGFNGFKGRKDPVEGARVVVELALAERGIYGSGFWEWEEGGLREVAW